MESKAQNTGVANPRLTFKKDERLCSKKVIEKLFSEGETFLSFPLKIVYLETPLRTAYPVQAAFTVSKKNFKKAVQRNRIKRLMREAYRLNKNLIYERSDRQQTAIFFIFIGKEMPDFEQVETAMKKGLNKLIKIKTKPD